jgi:hypothetical protein
MKKLLILGLLFFSFWISQTNAYDDMRFTIDDWSTLDFINPNTWLSIIYTDSNSNVLTTNAWDIINNWGYSCPSTLRSEIIPDWNSYYAYSWINVVFFWYKANTYQYSFYVKKDNPTKLYCLSWYSNSFTDRYAFSYSWTGDRFDHTQRWYWYQVTYPSAWYGWWWSTSQAINLFSWLTYGIVAWSVWPSPLQVVSTWSLHSEIYWLDLNQFETNEDFDLTYWIDDITNSNILIDSDILWTQTWWIIDLEFHTYNYEYGVDYELNLALEDINFATWTTTINYPFNYLHEV